MPPGGNEGGSPAGGTGMGGFALRAACFARGGKAGKTPPGVRGGKNTSVFLCRLPLPPLGFAHLPLTEGVGPGPPKGSSFEAPRGPTALFEKRNWVRRFSQEPWRMEPGAGEGQDACVSAARCAAVGGSAALRMRRTPCGCCRSGWIELSLYSYKGHRAWASAAAGGLSCCPSPSPVPAEGPNHLIRLRKQTRRLSERAVF